MKSLYNITRGQLLTVIVFGIIGWIFAMDKSDSSRSSDLYDVLVWFIPFVVIFYVIGWRNYHNIVTNINASSIFQRCKLFVKRNLRKIIAIIFISIIADVVLSNWDKIFYVKSSPSSNVITNKILPESFFPVSKVSVLDYFVDEDKGLKFYHFVVSDLGKSIDYSESGYVMFPTPITEGKFVKFSFLINSDNKTQTSHRLYQVILIDQNAREYKPMVQKMCDASFSEPHLFDSMIELKPGIPCKYEALYEVASDSVFSDMKIDTKLSR